MLGNKWDSLSENEQKIYQIIKQDPFISQQELANKVNLSRPSIANIYRG